MGVPGIAQRKSGLIFLGLNLQSFAAVSFVLLVRYK